MLRTTLLNYVDSHPFALGAVRLGIRLVSTPQRLRQARMQHADLASASALVPAILDQVGLPAGRRSSGHWTTHSAHLSRTGIAVIKVGPPHRPPTAVVKIPSSDHGTENQRRESLALAALRAEPGLGECLQILPDRLGEGVISGRTFVVEQAVAGLEMQSILGNPGRRTKALSVAARAIGEIHTRTATAAVVDEAVIGRWIDARLPVLENCSLSSEAVSRLGVELREAWRGRAVSLSWIHGDYWPGNVFLTPDCVSVSGIIDWERAVPGELPILDHLYLLIYARMFVERRQLGEVVRDLTLESPWTPHEREALREAAASLSASGEVGRATLLLFWLRHITLTLRDEPYLAGDWVWLTRNVENVLAVV